MEEREKLPVVIAHWIEHNESHMGEYRRWAEKAAELGLDQVKAGIDEAVEKLLQCNRRLEQILKTL